MSVNQVFKRELQDTELWLSREKDESTYRRDLKKRIELITWALENMQNPNSNICKIIEWMKF